MRKEEFKCKLFNFIENSTCAFTSASTLKKILLEKGFEELKESETWDLNPGKYYVLRNDASLIAFEIPTNFVPFYKIITTHDDTPALLLKPDGANVVSNYLRHNVMPYGGILNYGWLDHPLSLAGRVVLKEKDKLITKIIDLKKPLLIVPSVAIHLNDTANSNLDLNADKDLQPLLAITKNKNYLLKQISHNLNVAINDIIDYELFAYNVFKPVLVSDLVMAPRLDNLTSVFSGVTSFLESSSDAIKVFVAFNSEEIGSLTLEGADSSFLLDILKRVAASLKFDISAALASSLIVSADNTHAIHPNHLEYADKTGALLLGEGFALIKEAESTTNALSSAIIRHISKKNKIKFKDATLKNDLSGGSTLSGLSLRHVSVLSVDVGIASLAMHSSIEVASLSDIYALYKMMHLFYKEKFIISDNQVKFAKKN